MDTPQLSTQMIIFGVIIFSSKKGIFVEIQKFLHKRFNHSILHWGSFSHFLFLCIFRHFFTFLGFIIKPLEVTSRTALKKNVRVVFHIDD